MAILSVDLLHLSVGTTLTSSIDQPTSSQTFGSQQRCCIYLPCETSPIINCSFSLTVGLTLRRGMGVRPRMLTLCNTYIYIYTTVSLPTSTASMSMDGRGMCSKKKGEISLQCVQEQTFSYEGETMPKRRKGEITHKQTNSSCQQPLLSGKALKMYDCEFHIMRVRPQSGGFPQLSNNDLFGNSIQPRK